MKNLIKSLLCTGMSFLSITAFSQNYNLQFRSTITIPNQTLANICGYTQNGKEYALLGASNGMVIVDITNPDAPQQIVQIPASEGSPNGSSLWKEIKVYQHYAYVTTEAGGGLQVIDLSPLPSPALPYHNYTGDGEINGQLNAIHALHIDVTKGFLYAYGGGLFQGGAKVFDLNADPYNPVYVGKFDQLGYIHDGYADNDTLYAGNIYLGQVSIVDMADKSNPVLLGTVQTPGRFTHNTWLLDDHKHMLTTDENDQLPSFLTSFDISNPEDIQELDRVATTREGLGSIGHNTHVRNDWAITSWYTDGVTIVDAHRPDNLVEVARYDTWAPPTNPGDLFEGCWGAFPFFPSGTIVTSNIEPGVFNVFTPTYVRACYLEGTVLNGCNGAPLSGATIEVNTTEVRVNTTTKSNGVFKTGQVTPGNYTATISKPGFVSQTIPFTFATGQVAEMNVTLEPQSVIDLSGTVIDGASFAPVPNATVTVFSSSQSYILQANSNGQFNVDCVALDVYEASVGAWGYLSKTVPFNGATSLNITLDRGYYDDFLLDLGWETTSTSTTGQWEFGEPVGTFTNNGNVEVNPEFDASIDDNDQCYVTGNGGGNQSDNDIDNGSVTLTSPVMDLTGYNSAVLSFSYWFYNAGGNSTPNDKLQVNVVVDGQSFPVLTQNVSASQWRFSGPIPMPAAALFSNNVRVEFIAADDLPGHIVEAAVDVFKVELGTSGTINLDANALMTAAPNPSSSDFVVHYSWEVATDIPVMEVRNMLGQVVYAEKLSTRSGIITCGNNWETGIYFATLRSGSSQGTPVKLVKQ